LFVFVLFVFCFCVWFCWWVCVVVVVCLGCGVCGVCVWVGVGVWVVGVGWWVGGWGDVQTILYSQVLSAFFQSPLCHSHDKLVQAEFSTIHSQMECYVVTLNFGGE